MIIFACMDVNVCLVPKKALELELQTAVSSHVVARIKLGSSARTTIALTAEPSLQSKFIYFSEKV